MRKFFKTFHRTFLKVFDVFRKIILSENFHETYREMVSLILNSKKLRNINNTFCKSFLDLWIGKIFQFSFVIVFRGLNKLFELNCIRKLKHLTFIMGISVARDSCLTSSLIFDELSCYFCYFINFHHSKKQNWKYQENRNKTANNPTSIYLCIYLSIYLSIYYLVYLSIYYLVYGYRSVNVGL